MTCCSTTDRCYAVFAGYTNHDTRRKTWGPEVTHCFVGGEVVDYATTHSTPISPMSKGEEKILESWSSFYLFFACDSLCGNSTDLMHQHLRTTLQGGAYFQGQAYQRSHSRVPALYQNLKPCKAIHHRTSATHTCFQHFGKQSQAEQLPKNLTLLMTAPRFHYVQLCSTVLDRSLTLTAWRSSRPQGKSRRQLGALMSRCTIPLPQKLRDTQRT